VLGAGARPKPGDPRADPSRAGAVLLDCLRMVAGAGDRHASLLVARALATGPQRPLAAARASRPQPEPARGPGGGPRIPSRLLPAVPPASRHLRQPKILALDSSQCLTLGHRGKASGTKPRALCVKRERDKGAGVVCPS
jgi:hypothetical protein